MNAWDVLQQLYASEINGGLSADWDGGVSAWNGRTRLAERTSLRDEFDQIGDWLDDEARRLFPKSEYARNRFDSPAIPHGAPKLSQALQARDPQAISPRPSAEHNLESRSTVGVWIEQQLAGMARQRSHVHLRQIQLVDERGELLQMQRIFRDLRRTNFELATFREAGDASR